MARKRDKLPLFRWHGMLGDMSTGQRMMTLLVLFVTVVTLTFTQMGMLHISVGGDRNAYVVYLLAPIAVAAVALGPLWSVDRSTNST